MQKRLNGPPPVYRAEELEKEPLNPEEGRLKNLLIDPSKKGETRPRQELLQVLDNELFKGQVEYFRRFREFDQDHDGYVSTSDIRSTMRKLNVIKENEI